MKKIFKWLGIILASLLLILSFTAFYLQNAAQKRLTKRYEVNPRPIMVPHDSASIAAGQRWASVLCANCHGENFAGTRFFDSPDLGLICAPNLTPAGAVKSYSDIDWVRSIRHGINAQGHPLLIMPAKEFSHMSDEHTGQIIAYLKSLAPIEQAWPKPSTSFLCDILFQTGAFGDALNAETIDHVASAQTAPPKAESAEYGHYLVKIGGCTTCHGQQLNGGKDPNPEAPYGPNLTPGGQLPSWKSAGFITAMRTGVTPAGKTLDGRFMPWRGIGRYDDEQLKAIYAYLMSLQSLKTAEKK